MTASARAWLSRHLRPLMAAVALSGLAWAAWSQRDAIAAFDRSADRGRLALAVALFAVTPLAQALTFALGLRRIGADGPGSALARVWARSFLLRYEPSGAVGFVYRFIERERIGASTAQVLTVTGYEQLAVVVAGAAAAMAGFLGAGVHPPVPAVVLFAGAVVAVIAARPRFVGGWLHDRLKARGIETAGPLRGRTLAAMVALDAAGWIATGLGAWTLARALQATGGLDAFLLLGAFALSWLLGVLIPLAPGGVGVRDGSLIVTRGRDRCRPGDRARARAAARLVRRRVTRDRRRRARGVGRRAPRSGAGRADHTNAAGARPPRHHRRRADLLRGAGAAAFRRALRPHRPRAADRRRRLPRRHRRARRGPRRRAPVDARPAPPRQGRPRHRLPRRVRLVPAAQLPSYRTDGLRPLAPAREAPRDARRARRSRGRPRARQPLHAGRRHRRLVEGPARAQPASAAPARSSSSACPSTTSAAASSCGARPPSPTSTSTRCSPPATRSRSRRPSSPT
jgi:hypothetical protein